MDLFSVRKDSESFLLEFFLLSQSLLLLLLLLLVVLLDVLDRHADQVVVLYHSRVHVIVINAFVQSYFVN
jgi:hypothetical protein